MLRRFVMQEDPQKSLQNIKFFFPIMVELLYINTFVFFFIVVAYSIKVRFDIINQILMVKFSFADQKNTRNCIIEVINSYPSTYILKILSILHIQLNDVISLINKLFALPIMLFLAYNLCGSTFALYESYDIIFSGQENLRQLGYTLGVYVMNINYFAYNFTSIVMSVGVASVRNKTAEILNEILCKKIDGKLRNKIKVFLLQIRSSTADFSCGLFTFDWTILFAVSLSYNFEFKNHKEFLILVCRWNDFILSNSYPV